MLVARRLVAVFLVVFPVVFPVVFTVPAAAQARAPADARVERERVAFEQRLAEAEVDLVPRLEELAEWARKNRLYRERDRLLRAILSIDPGHSVARKGLRYYRQGSGWHQSTAYRVPRNHAEDALEEYAERLAHATGPFRSDVFRLLERKRRSIDPGAREAVIRKLLLIDPDDVSLRTVLGETRLGERWVLDETARAMRVRADIQELARISIEAVEKPAHANPTKDERKIDLAWNAVRKTPKVRVVGTTKRAEVDETTRVADAIGVYFQGLFQHSQPHRRAYTIYLLQGFEERDRLLAGMDWLKPDTKQLLQGAGGGWLGRRNLLGEWDPDPERRLDGAARQTLGTLLMDAYGVDGRHGWAWEGVGLYLVYHMVGTRKTYFIDRTGYARSSQSTLWPALQNPETDWLVAGSALLASERAPGLEFLLGRTVDTMRDEDLLMAYVLAAYLLEGRPDDAPEILARIGKGEHPIDVFEDVTGLSIPVLEARLRRWLGEVIEIEATGTRSTSRR